jgi:hypothetical protein
MEIVKMIGFLSPVSKSKDNIDFSELFGQDIIKNTKLYNLLENIFKEAEKDGKIKEISEYWIKDFLKSELKMNSKRGSRIVAKALRKVIT